MGSHCSTWRRWVRRSRRERWERCASWDADPVYAGSGRGGCGPLGSLGDRLVWAGWLPFTSALALIGVALGLGLPAILGFIVVYNVGHVALRWWALRAGWTYGAGVAQALREPLLQRATALSGPAMALVVGAALPLVAQYLSSALVGWARLALAGVVAGGFALLWWQRARLTGLRLGLALLALAALAGWLWP